MQMSQIARASVFVTTALALTACGGGGGGMSFIPTPPVTPTTPTPNPPPPPGATAADAIVAATGTNQAFTSSGGTVRLTTDPPSLSIASSDQLQIRYDSASQQYQVQLPATSAWQGIFLDRNPNAPDFYLTPLRESADTGYSYSALGSWGAPDRGLYGGVAFGIPTAPGGVPTTGSATYNGSIAGITNEIFPALLGGPSFPAIVTGTINLSFNFGAGSLSGSLTPTLSSYSIYTLAPLSFKDTVFSVGSTSFSGAFDSAVAGRNSFAGQFTGPGAQELIGNFSFPYTSHDDGKVYQAAGGFAAKQ
jgi:hypothetical protein